MTGSIEERLATFVAETTYRDVPEAAVDTAERAFVDTVGVTLAGAGEPAARTARTVFAGPEGEASVLGTDRRAAVDAAALVNATAGHALDYDDVIGEVWHPSVTLVAPALAVGERVGASGRELVTAFAVGFETERYLGDRILPGHYERGWHATATLGVFGAAAAAGSLLDLDETAAERALGAAASTPAGLKRNFGTMVKPLHPGLAARSGVTAALLADAGFTAADGAVGGDGGFLDLYAGAAGATTAGWSPGEAWTLADGVRVKKYPCCYFTHSAIAAAESLRRQHDVSPGDVASVTVRASRAAADALRYSAPTTGLEGKFSMEHAVAAAIVHDRVGFDAFTDAAVAEPETAAVRERVSAGVDPDLPAESYRATVELETVDGESHVRDATPPGTPAEPLSAAERRAKFEDCLDYAGVAVPADAAYETLGSLRDVDDATRLIAELTPG